MDQSQVDSNFVRKTRLTPRSVEAFRRSGILPSDIVYPCLEDNSELAHIRLKAALDCRDNFMKVLARDYAIIKDLAAEGKWIPSDGSQAHTLNLRHQNSTVID